MRDRERPVTSNLLLYYSSFSYLCNFLFIISIIFSGNVTIKILIEVKRVTLKDTQQWDPAEQEEVEQILVSEMSKTFFKTRADVIATKDIPSHLQNYLEGILDLPVVTVT